MTVNRRDLVLRAALLGGYGAAMTVMHALGIAPAAAAVTMARDPAIGRGRRVIVLGAGVAGLVAAYELVKSGFDVTVLESRARVGGRNWTVRGGDRVQGLHGRGQDVLYEAPLYFNCGPARLPSTHETIMGYCRELGVPLEVQVNASRGAYVVRGDGRRVRMRQLVNDTRGLMSEMLAKFANQGLLDEAVDGVERAQILDFLRAYGDLGEGDRFVGTARSGYAVAPGAGPQAGVAVDKIDWALLSDPSVRAAHVFEEIIAMQPTMFQPVGGMDQIPKAFARALDTRVRLGCQVRAVEIGAAGVEVTWREAGETRARSADFVVATLPPPLLARVASNFSAPFAQALRSVESDHSCKVAWQAPRFWETDDQIYGGLTYVDHETRFLWYPSHGMHQSEGVFLGCYNSGETAQAFARKPRAAQIESSRAAVELAHPGRGALLKNPISIDWRDMPYSEGPWARLSTESAVYARLNEPEGRVYLAGDYLSHMVGWQEGAALSAHRAVADIAARTQAANLAEPS